MAKINILFSRILEGETNATIIEEELNRTLSLVGGEILNVQIVELQPDKEFKLYVLTK